MTATVVHTAARRRLRAHRPGFFVTDEEEDEEELRILVVGFGKPPNLQVTQRV